MPSLIDDGEFSTESHNIGGSNYSFTAARITDLGATEYTLVTIAIDVTGSVTLFADQLRQSLVTAVESCKKSDRRDNLLVRVVEFSTRYDQPYVRELHGFVPVLSIDTTAYPAFKPGGATPLYDAAYDCLGATAEYARKLSDEEYPTNAICFLVTDGGETGHSTATAKMIADTATQLRVGEELESVISILVGINTQSAGVADALKSFKDEAGLTHFIDAGEATPQKLAQMAEFVSQSISSQSQALGTGGPSQHISATI